MTITQLDTVTDLLIEKSHLLDQSADAILSRDMNDRIRFWNKGAERIFGWRAEEVAGRFLPDLLMPEPDAYRHARQKLFVSDSWTGDIVKRNRWGEALIVECHWTLIRDALENPWSVLAVDVDVTQKRQAEAQLRLAATVFDTAAEAIVITGAAGEILQVNRALTAQTGYSAAEIVGQPWHMLCSRAPQAQGGELASDAPWQGEAWVWRKGGETYPVWLSVNPVSPGLDRTYRVHVLLDISQHKEMAARIEHMGFHDPLTRLPNRAFFGELLRRALARAERHSTTLALLFLDIDRFKEINDTAGHDFGDQAIAEAAERFRTALRQEEVLARLDGDDFALIATIRDQADALAVAERWRGLLAAPLSVLGRQFRLEATVGIALYPQDGTTADELIKHADIAMSHAKRAHLGSSFFQMEMSAAVAREAKLVAELRHALGTQGLELYYQPFVDLRSGDVVGAEALLRWRHAELGWVSPAEFVLLAERQGFGGTLDDWVLTNACAQMKAWAEEGCSLPGRLAINVGAQRIGDPDYAARAVHIVATAGLAPEQFELEITETHGLAEPAQSMNSLLALKQAGFSLAVDDFGTGYSSLAYLTHYPLAQVKIDMSFVHGMGSKRSAHAVVAATLAMARDLGMKSLAEGIETPGQREMLLDMGCDLGQGYLFDRPLPPAQFSRKWLAR